MIDITPNFRKSWSILKTYHVGIIGATTLIGQHLTLLLENHPWFKITALSATPESAGHSYPETVRDCWAMDRQIPSLTQNMTLWDTSSISSISRMSSSLDFIFCALDAKDEGTLEIEEEFACCECPVVSSSAANRFTSDVPMIIPEINPEHSKIIPSQRERLGTKRGFIATKPNSSIRRFVSVLSAFSDLNVDKVLVCSNQLVSKSDKNYGLQSPYDSSIIQDIPEEETQINREPLKIFGRVRGGELVLNHRPLVTSQCIGAPSLNSQSSISSVFVSFRKNYNSIENLYDKIDNFNNSIQYSNLPSSPNKLINYPPDERYPYHITSENNLDHDLSVSISKIRSDSQYNIKFISTLNNSHKRAASETILLAELLAVQGYLS